MLGSEPLVGMESILLVPRSQKWPPYARNVAEQPLILSDALVLAPRAAVKLSVTNCVVDCVRLDVSRATEWQRIGN